jgi:uncharacterized membrane protein SpoIIM required for sporulation
MRQDDFIARHEAGWTELEDWLRLRGPARIGAREPADKAVLDDLDFPARYRRVCQHLALAQRRGYSPRVLERLEALAQRGHDVLYRPPAPRLQRLVGFFGADYPRLVRRHARYMWLSAALFFVPLITMIVLLQFRPELVHSVLDPDQIRMYERMYDPASPSHHLGRESGTNVEMFGMYIYHNISIGFQCFASGLLFCVGAIFTLVFNGIAIGTVAGHLTEIGYGDPFWRFVSGHSGFELSAVVLSGGAGLRIGWALIAPGRLTRRRALVEAGMDGAQIVYGVVLLLVIAAFVEAFWSSIGWMPSSVKFSVGGLVWVVVWYWIWRGGRDAA